MNIKKFWKEFWASYLYEVSRVQFTMIDFMLGVLIYYIWYRASDLGLAPLVILTVLITVLGAITSQYMEQQFGQKK